MRLPIRDDIKGSEIAAAINELYDSLQWQDPTNNPDLGKIEPLPQYLREGMRAYANGVDWNPGAGGAGYYRRVGGAWVKELGPTDTIANATNATNADTADTVDNFHASQTPTASYLLAAASDGTMPIKPIWDKTITGAAVTSVTTDGEVTLDGLVHGGYDFEVVLKNTSGSSVTLRMFINNDTTDANYAVQLIGALGAGVGGASGALAILNSTLIAASSEVTFRGIISISPSGFVTWSVTHLRTDNGIETTVGKKTASVANLTRLDFTVSVASSIGIDSRFRLWRRI